MTVLAQSNPDDCGCSLADLARKYRLLLDLRRGAEPFDARTLRRLAREFPGALRELDALPMPALEDRARAVDEAARTSARLERWIEWMMAYHESMRTVLAVRSRLLSRRESPRPETFGTEPEFDAAFLAAVMKPPEGRLNVLVFGRLAERFGCSPQEIEARLFRAEVA